MATPYLREVKTDDKRLTRLENQVDRLVDNVSDVKSDVSSMRASMEGLKTQVSGMHDSFDKLDKSIADLGKSLGTRVSEVEKEQSKTKLKWAKISGGVLLLSILIAGTGGKILALLGALL